MAKIANPLVTDLQIRTSNAQRWLYALGNLGCAIPYQAVGAVLLYFYVDVQKLSPVWAAAVMTGYSIYNAINNPAMGYISDRTKTRWGRRVPYILFGTIPYALFFTLLFLVPFDGATQPIPLLIWFAAALFLFETMATVVQTAYYSLLPEMYSEYKDRTGVSVRMNIFMTVGLIVGAALPIVLAGVFGWDGMAALLGLVTAAALLAATRGMFERRSSLEAPEVPLGPSLRATFLNRSFVTIVIAQTMRHFATSVAASGLAFYTKYSLGADPASSSIILATIFIVATLALYPWKVFLANRLEPRTTLLIAYVLMGLSTIPLFLAQSLVAAFFTAAFMGIALAGLLLMGDVTLSDVIDEDEIKTGQRREGMYFGMSGLIITLAYALSSIVFGWVSSAYGYNPLLTQQPESVALGFRVFISIPPAIGSLFAILSLLFYPLHGKRLQAVKNRLREKMTGA
jgi:GPH family glycoside/pentoside/hexuronide:cation symporter